MKVTALANKNWLLLFASPLLLLTSLLVAMALLSTNAQAFTDLDGKPDSINKHIGKNKWTIVEVWVSDCHTCRMHMPQIVKFDGKLKNVRILGVSLDGQAGIDKAEEFIVDFAVKFPTIITNPVEMSAWMEQSIGEPLRGTPSFILFDPEGKLVAAQPGVVAVASLEKFIMDNSKTPDSNAAKSNAAKS